MNVITKARTPFLLLSASALSLSAHANEEAYNDDTVEEIIVVGSKTKETRQELTTSLGYFNQDRLDNERIYDVEDAFDRTANAFTGTAGFGAYSIRGVNNNGIVGALNNSNALASIVVNQVALGITSGDYIKPSLFDAASVEILRGPQSAIQGPNSLIGAVYINYNKPSFEGFDGRVRVEAGELGTLNAALAQNAVLVDDFLAARVVLESRKSDGAAVNTTTGSDDVQRLDQQNLRLALRAQPKGDDSLVFDLSYQYVDNDSNPFGLVVPPPGGDLFDREQPYDVDDEYPADFHQVAFEALWNINENLSITSITGWNDLDVTQEFDGDLTQFDFLAVNGEVTENLLSQELRLNYQGESFDALLGFFYSDGEYVNGFSGVGIFPDGMGGVQPFNTTTRNVENIEQVAFFGKANVSVYDDLTLSLGLRWNREERDTINFADNNGLVSDLDAVATFDQLIPSAALKYDISEQTSVGVSYARGFQAGGIAFAVFLGQSGAYDEEFTDNYELFFRHQSADGQFLFNTNLFYLDWSDQQITTTLPGGFPGFDDLVVNAGKSRVWGLETEIEWQPTDEFNTFLSVGVTDTEFRDFVLNGVDLAGTEFPQAPNLNISIGVNYEADNGFFASGTFAYTSSAFTEIAAPEATALSSRELLSGRVGYRRDFWSVYAWATNLLDDDYELGLFDGATFGLPGAYGRVGAPRTVGAGIEFTW